MQRAIAAAVVMVSALVDVGPATGHDVACERALREAPIEMASLPQGWAWDDLRWNALGIWNGTLGGTSFRSLILQCSDDAAATMERQRELRAFVGSTEAVTVGAVGDEAQAYSDGDLVYIEWRHGDVLGGVSSDGSTRLERLEEFAIAIDELLP